MYNAFIYDGDNHCYDKYYQSLVLQLLLQLQLEMCFNPYYQHFQKC